VASRLLAAPVERRSFKNPVTAFDSPGKFDPLPFDKTSIRLVNFSSLKSHWPLHVSSLDPSKEKRASVFSLLTLLVRESIK
jgi:hypothetical protein